MVVSVAVLLCSRSTVLIVSIENRKFCKGDRSIKRYVREFYFVGNLASFTRINKISLDVTLLDDDASSVRKG